MYVYIFLVDHNEFAKEQEEKKKKKKRKEKEEDILLYFDSLSTLRYKKADMHGHNTHTNIQAHVQPS
jgi:hypothetical protein